MDATNSVHTFKPSPSTPAHAGDVLTVYCTGLGEVHPAVPAGLPSPSKPAAQTNQKVTATIGGIAAEVQFAGLTPGFAGLNQVNVKVPNGVTPGDQVPLVLTVAGQSSVPVTVALR